MKRDVPEAAMGVTHLGREASRTPWSEVMSDEGLAGGREGRAARGKC